MSAVIWRYMDHWKFVSLLKGRALYFSRVDLLVDPFEGALPEQHRWYKSLGGRPGTPVEAWPGMRPFAVVNCWHINEAEDIRMWTHYTTERRAVAVRSTVRRLRRSLDRFVRVAPVRYVDYSQDDLDMSPLPPGAYDVVAGDDWLMPYFRKRLEFVFERELRAFVQFEPGQDIGRGALVAVNLPVLIETVVVSPRASVRYLEEVSELLRGFDLKAVVRASTLTPQVEEEHDASSHGDQPGGKAV